MSTLVPFDFDEPRAMQTGHGRRSSPLSWRWRDRLALILAWCAGIGLVLIAGAIVGYFAFRGVQYLRPGLLFSRPQISTSQAGSGGFLDPLLGTMILTFVGIVLALPLGVTTAVWMSEYARPRWLARTIESCVEIVAGTPDIVIALFGLAVFELSFMGPFSFKASGGGVYGRSFLAAGAMMSLIAMPPIFAATRDGLQAVPGHMREAAFALGKTRITTIRRVLLPSVRSNMATGVTLGISRIIGDTAIVVLLLGESTAPGIAGLGPRAGAAARDRLDAHQLRLRQLPGGRRRGAAEGLCRRLRAAGVRTRLNLLVERIGRGQERATGLSVATGAV